MKRVIEAELKFELCSEDGLLKHLHGSNLKAFEFLYKKQFKKLLLISFKYTGDALLSEEIVNDVFTLMWTKQRFLDVKVNLFGYLARSVVNSSLNHLRSKKVSDRKLQSLSFEEVDDPYDTSLLEEKMTRLDEAIHRLPEKCKNVLIMSRFDRKKQQEIAKELNISIKTVKNHLTYGIKKLRQMLYSEVEQDQWTS